MGLHEARQLGQSTVMEDGQRASALWFGDQRVMALVPDQRFPSELAQALDKTAEGIEAWTNQAFMPQIGV